MFDSESENRDEMFSDTIVVAFFEVKGDSARAKLSPREHPRAVKCGVSTKIGAGKPLRKIINNKNLWLFTVVMGQTVLNGSLDVLFVVCPPLTA
jgi:hypothetical protein